MPRLAEPRSLLPRRLCSPTGSNLGEPYEPPPVGDLDASARGYPQRVEVATSPATSSDGYFLTENVKAFDALLEVTQTSWVFNYQLEPGIYYVHIAGLDTPC